MREGERERERWIEIYKDTKREREIERRKYKKRRTEERKKEDGKKQKQDINLIC